MGDRRAAARKGVSVRSALQAVFVFYIAAALLNGRHMYEAASRRPYGPARTFWVSVTKPIARVTVALGLDRVRAFFEPLQDTESEP